MSFRSTPRTPRDFKKGMDTASATRRREDQRLSLRKQRREREFRKRRLAFGDQDETKQDPLTPAEQLEGVKDLQNIKALVAGLSSRNKDTRLNCARRIRKLVSIEKNPPIGTVIENQAHVHLMSLLVHDSDDEVQFEAAWALTNLISGSHEDARAVIGVGALGGFVKGLDSKSSNTVDQCLWGLGNIAGDCVEFRDLVVQQDGLFSRITELTSHETMSIRRNATWTLTNIYRHKPHPRAYNNLYISCLRSTLKTDDTECLSDTLWGLTYFTDVDAEDSRQIQLVCDHEEIVSRLVELMSHPSTEISHPAMRSLGNIVTGDEHQTQIAVDAGLLDGMSQLLKSAPSKLLKEACWAISNVTAGNEEQVSMVLESGLFEQLASLSLSARYEVRKEIIWVFTNAVSIRNEDHLEWLSKKSCLQVLVDFMSPSQFKPTTMMAILEALEVLVEHGEIFSDGGKNLVAERIEELGGLDQMEEIQQNEEVDVSVYEKIVTMIQSYWELEDEDDEDLQPQVDSNGSYFTFGSGTASAQTFSF